MRSLFLAAITEPAPEILSKDWIVRYLIGVQCFVHILDPSAPFKYAFRCPLARAEVYTSSVGGSLKPYRPNLPCDAPYKLQAGWNPYLAR